jgi:carboxyl-terminal processing protease
MRSCRSPIMIALSAFLAVSLFLPLELSALSEKGYKALHNFTKVLHYIETNYASEVDEEELIDGAISGMLRTLDPHSVYMRPELYRELKVDTRGRFDGIGIEVTVRDRALTVVAPIKGSPASKQGIRAGDKILKINGHYTKDLNLSEAVSMMRGRRGSQVTLTLGRKGSKRPIDITITRRVIKVPSVNSRFLQGGYAYLSISNFQQGTARAVRKGLKKLSKKERIEGLVLDLRHDPGGLLDQSIAVSDIFLSSGVIVTTRTRGKEIDRRVAHEEGTQPDYPIVVLVDGGTASAAEIVAGALQDNKRATVMGTTSFGKGSVQTVIDLDGGSGLKLTIAHYYTPSDKLIHGIGIKPDVVVPAHAPKKKGAKTEEPSSASRDYQLEKALEFLQSGGKIAPRKMNKHRS